ncbi:MAG: hypothetical protein KA096_02705 [Bacteroidales bacterium]|nr:hypothetical protein [Bacteroidales bacterium]
MKKIVVLSALLVGFIAMFSSCNQSEEKKLIKLWKLKTYYFDGKDQRPTREYLLEFREDKTYITRPAELFVDSPGTWSIPNNERKTIVLQPKSGDAVILEITKLTSDEFTFQLKYDEHVDEFCWEAK